MNQNFNYVVHVINFDMIFLYPLLPLPSVNIHISGHSYDMISSVSFFFLSLALKPMQGVCCTPALAACTMMGAQNFIFLLLSLCIIVAVQYSTDIFLYCYTYC